MSVAPGTGSWSLWFRSPSCSPPASPRSSPRRTRSSATSASIYGAYFLAVCLATHIYLRIRLPNADPYLFPLVALLTAFGLVMIYRIDDDLARDQANWFVLGLVLFALTIQFLRDYEVLERYRYTIAVGRAAAAAGAAPAGDRPAGQRRLPRGQDRPARLPAGRVLEDLHRRLPRQLPARAPRGADRRRPARARGDAAAAQALRADAGRLGRLDVHARLHPRPRQLADVLRRLPRPALRRDRALLLRRHRDGDVPRRRLVLRLAPCPTSTTGSRSGSTPTTTRSGNRATRSCSRSSPRPTAASSAKASARR